MSTQEQPRRPHKWERVLRALATGRSLNRFEAAREIHDHCLHSTVADLEAKGVMIERATEVVSGTFGPVHCKRYRLGDGEQQRALELLGAATAAKKAEAA